MQWLASCSVTQDIIARYLHVAPMTLRLHFREELDFAAMKANQAVAINMFRIATTGNGSAAVTAGFKWLAIRAGWKETSALDVTMAGGGGLSGLLKRCLGEDAETRNRTRSGNRIRSSRNRIRRRQYLRLDKH